MKSNSKWGKFFSASPRFSGANILMSIVPSPKIKISDKHENDIIKKLPILATWPVPLAESNHSGKLTAWATSAANTTVAKKKFAQKIGTLQNPILRRFNFLFESIPRGTSKLYFARWETQDSLAVILSISHGWKCEQCTWQTREYQVLSKLGPVTIHKRYSREKQKLQFYFESRHYFPCNFHPWFQRFLSWVYLGFRTCDIFS